MSTFLNPNTIIRCEDADKHHLIRLISNTLNVYFIQKR